MGSQVAATSRTSTGTAPSAPSGRTLPSSTARRSLACTSSPSCATSSMKSVPPVASRNAPFRSAIAPVNAPRRWPNSSLSASSRERLAALSATNGPARRSLSSCTARATSSFPVPLSPRTSTGSPRRANRRTRSARWSIGGDEPTRPRSGRPVLSETISLGRNTSRTHRPSWTRAPGWRSARSTRSPSSSVPFFDPRSLARTWVLSCSRRRCLWLTVSSARTRSAPAALPTTIASPGRSSRAPRSMKLPSSRRRPARINTSWSSES